MLTDRRGFLRSLGGVRRDAEAPPPAAPRAERCATAAELTALAGACGLAARLDDVRALARTSVRLTPAVTRTGSYLGGAAALALDLAQLARLMGPGDSGASRGLPARGVLWCSPSGRVTVDGRRASGRFPLALSAERVLPRVWAAPAQALGLSLDETAGWEELRTRLAALQGPAPDHAMRVFGYPEDKRGDMPDLCARRAGAGDWELLLQLHAGSGRRLFVWLPGPGEIGRAVAFRR